MRLYAFFLFALCAVAARAATIPENVAEKKISVVPENTDKAPENISSEQELVDQSNTINDVDNKLRTKPEDIPVEVIVENIALKAADESDEIVRPPVDLRNPGPPQRQEHETQNPEFYAAEQQIVQLYKQNLNDAQATVRQGLQSVSNDVQNMLQGNEPINMIQQSIQTLRETFMAQVNRFNSTIQDYLENSAQQQTKANVQMVESGLTALKNDFNRGVQKLNEGVRDFPSMKAEGENVPAAVAPPATGPIATFIADFQNRVQSGFNNLTTAFNNMMSQVNQPAAAANPPADAQSGTPALADPPANWFQSNPMVVNIYQWLQNLQNTFSGTSLSGGSTTQATTAASQAASAATSAPNPPPEPSAQPNQAEAATAGPIRQILQKNPITKGIASAVQRLQNIGNPETPRVPANDNTVEATNVDDKVRRHPPAVRDNNDSNSSGVEASEPAKEVQDEIVPEAQETKKEEVKEQMAEQVVDKTE